MTIAEDKQADERYMSRRFTNDEYYRMGEQGFFENQRVQLIDGEIIVMSPQKSPHALMMEKLTRLFSRALSDEFRVRVQLPLSINDDSEPEPDIAIVMDEVGTHLREHPSTAKLVIEVSDSTLRLDRRKADLYASAAVVEYWIIDLTDQSVHVHTLPMLDESAKLGARFANVRTFKIGESIEPTGVPMGVMKVADLLRAR